MTEAKLRVLVLERQLQKHIERLAELLGRRYQGKRLFVIGIMNSSYAFLAALTEAIGRWNDSQSRGSRVEMIIDFLAPVKGGQGVRRDVDIINIEGQEVLIVDGLLKTGRTVAQVANFLYARRPARIGIVTMLKKNDCLAVRLRVAFYDFGLVVPDVIVAGKGLDHKGHLRELPFIAEVIPPRQ